MNPFSNAWKHPRSSTAGLLIAVVTIMGVLSQQGITLGKAGTGTVVSLVTAMASALLGLLARDPIAAPAPAPLQQNQPSDNGIPHSGKSGNDPLPLRS
jgi:hypothetical protein